MFVQIIKGPVQDAVAVRAVANEWLDRLAAGADGWESTTAGVAADRTLVVVGAFSTAEQAQRNSERPEQGEWFAKFGALFTGPVEFRNCSEVTTVRGAASADADSVQVIAAGPSAPQGASSPGCVNE